MVISSRMDRHHAVLLLFSIFCAACCHAYPLKKPENLSCILSQDDNKDFEVMTCTWDLSAASYLQQTTYELCYKKFEHEYCATAGERNGAIRFNTAPFFMTISIWVRVTNNLKTVNSDTLQLDVANIIKPSPPENIRLTPEKNLPNTMMVQWDTPKQEILRMRTLHYIIRYCVNGSNTWNEVPSSETKGVKNSFRLQSLMPFTDYVVQMYCKISENNRFWSEWSGNVTAKTPEASQ